MNLVQINEHLKDLPMQVIQQYANGMNPEVPPYLALGELQRREMAQKQMANAQGAAQGPQPSIKEQVEQKAGLMAAQGLQQQQMMQQMAQPRGPMPAPAGIPQPEAQPEVAMARGGLAGIPVRRDMFEYAGGGIVAFAEAGTVEDPRRERKEGENFADFRKRMFALDLQLQREKNAARDTDREAERQRRLAERGEEFTVPPSPFMDRPPLPSPTGAPKAMSDPVKPASPVPPPAPAGGLPAALTAAGATGVKPPAPPRPAAQPPAAMPPAAPTGLPAALAGTPSAATIPTSPAQAELEALMKSQQRQAPTAEGIIADVNALKPAGMQDEARAQLLADQRARAEARQASFDSSKPDRIDDIIRVLGQAGQFKGFSGIGPAYTAMQQQRRAEDLAMQRQQDELLTAIESRGTAFDKDTFTARTGAMDKAQTLFGQSQKSILDAAAAKLGADQGRLDKQSQINMQRDLEEFKAIQDRELKGMDIAQRERESKRADARSPAARASNFVAMRQRARDLRAEGKIAEADRLNAQAEDMKSFEGGSAKDGGPSTTDRLRAAQTLLQNATSEEEAALARAEISGIMSSGGASSGAAKTMTQADVLATAKASGKTPQQVIDAAKARGFTIQ